MDRLPDSPTPNMLRTAYNMGGLIPPFLCSNPFDCNGLSKKTNTVNDKYKYLDENIKNLQELSALLKSKGIWKERPSNILEKQSQQLEYIKNNDNIQKDLDNLIKDLKKKNITIYSIIKTVLTQYIHDNNNYT